MTPPPLVVRGILAGVAAALTFRHAALLVLSVPELVPAPSLSLKPAPQLAIPAIALVALWGGFWGAIPGPTHELLTGVRRPAGDETGIEWRGAAGGEVGFVLVHTSPRMSWTRGLSSTPDCATGRSPAPEHVS